MVGQKYNRLFVESFAGTKKNGNGSIALWNCLCDCGNKCVASGKTIRNGKTKSCGCLRAELSSQRRKKDLTNQRFTKLLVLREAYTKKYSVYWECLCDCGNIVYVPTHRLTTGTTKSCGCIIKDIMGPKLYVDITGQRSGKLVAKYPTGLRSHRQVLWLCECDCGGETLVTTTDFKNGHIISCGCVKSKGEEEIGKELKTRKIKFKKGYKLKDLYIDNGKNRKTRLPFDFGVLDDNGNLLFLIEYQGIQHFQETSRNGFGDQQRLVTDDMKRNFCLNNNIYLYEIRYDENIKNKIDEILHAYANSVGNKI